MNYDVVGSQDGAYQHVFHTEDLDGAVLPRRSTRAIEPPPSSTSLSGLAASLAPPNNGIKLQTSQKPMTDQTVIKSATGTSSNVTYSTDNSNNLTTQESTVSSLPATLKSDTGKDSTVVVSNPINPTNGQPVSKEKKSKKHFSFLLLLLYFIYFIYFCYRYQ